MIYLCKQLYRYDHPYYQALLYPRQELRQATAEVFETFGGDVFQYGNSEGYAGLRELIAARYRRKGLDVAAEDVLITNGSQQGLDLLGKILVNEGDDVVIEEPGYLGAIQAFSIFRPHFRPVALTEEGMDVAALRSVMVTCRPKLMYAVPNFQNPSGISYSEAVRQEVAALMDGTPTVLVEDDPYGDLRYSGIPATSFGTLLPSNTVLLGSFSKTAVPGFRLGWIVAHGEMMDKLVIAKQAADLHTSQFTQCVLYQYLKTNDIDAHIARIREAYGRQLRTMSECMDECFPESVSRTHPQGGMFIWAALHKEASSRALLELAMKDKVIFVPGDPFYVGRSETNTMRLNFSCADEETIRKGVKRLGAAISRLLRP